MTVRFQSRSVWTSKASKSDRRTGGIRGTAVHWPGGTGYKVDSSEAGHARCIQLIQGIARSHMVGRGYSDIAYNDIACQHGYLIEGRGDGRVSAANGDNEVNVEYGSVLGLLSEDDTPTDAMLEAIAASIDRQARPAYTHNQVRIQGTGRGTECPGPHLTAWVHAGAKSPGTSTPIEEDDMPYTEKQLSDIVTKAVLALKDEFAIEDWTRFVVVNSAGKPVPVREALQALYRDMEQRNAATAAVVPPQ